MRTRLYGGVRGRKTKVGGKPTSFSSYSIFLFPKFSPKIDGFSIVWSYLEFEPLPRRNSSLIVIVKFLEPSYSYRYIQNA